MQIVTMRRKTKVCASGLALVCIVMIVGYFAVWADRNVSVYDDNFKILECSISRGKSHAFYSGSQTVGCIRDKLSNQFGLKFLGPSSIMRMTMTSDALVFFVRYKGDFPFEELDALQAVLTNGKDIFEQLPGPKNYDQTRRTFTRFYMTDKLRASDEPLRIDFYLNFDYDKPVATWRVGELLKHNKGQNTGL